MNRLKRILTARKMSLSLIFMLAVMLFLSTVIPQRIDSIPERMVDWRRMHEGLLWLVDAFNLHSIYAQTWFSVIILFAVLSLGLSSFDQLLAARKKLFSAVASDELTATATKEWLCNVAAKYGYIALRADGGEQLKFVKNPWGYFGVLMIHIGMTLVLAVSLYVALTGRQVALVLVEGDMANQQRWNNSEQGLFSSPLKLPEGIRLEKLSVSFDNKNQPADVSSNILIRSQSGTEEPFKVSINRICSYNGLRIYHSSQYGDVFTVVFTDKEGIAHSEKIAVQQPTKLEKAGYSSNFNVVWTPYLFAAKYYADIENKSMTSGNPLLVLRMLDGKKEKARTSLSLGKPGILGDYRVQLFKIEKWAKIIIVDISGISAIFAGFAIIMLGGLIHYMSPPRELVAVMQQNGSYRVLWRAVYFREFYLEERDEIMAQLEEGVF